MLFHCSKGGLKILREVRVSNKNITTKTLRHKELHLILGFKLKSSLGALVVKMVFVINS